VLKSAGNNDPPVWGDAPSGLPSYSGSGIKLLTTDGTTASWTEQFPQYWDTGVDYLKILGSSNSTLDGGFIGTCDVSNGPFSDNIHAHQDATGTMATHTFYAREILPYRNTGGNAATYRSSLNLGSVLRPITKLYIGPSAASDQAIPQIGAECSIDSDIKMGFNHKITTGDPTHSLFLTTHTGSSANVHIGTGGAAVDPKLVVHAGIDFFASDTNIASQSDTNGILTRLNRTVHMPSDFKDTDGNDITPDTEYILKTGPSGSLHEFTFKLQTKVYFSVQMRVGAQSGTSDHNSYINYLNEVSEDVTDQQGLAGTAPDFTDSVWDVNSILSSGGTDQSNFPTQGFVVPRTGIYKIDCYQTIPANNAAPIGSLLVYKNPIIGNANHWAYPYGPNPGDTTNLIAGTEVSALGQSQSKPADASIVWLGQLTAGDAIKFVIRFDNGFGPITALTKGCFTIVSVD